MKKFIPWLVAFIVLLCCIPILLNQGYIVPAKILGFVLVVAVSVALRIWLKKALLKKTSEDSIRFTINERYTLNELSPVYRNAGSSFKKEIEKRLGKLISALDFDTESKNDPKEDDCLAFGLLLLFSNWNEGFRQFPGKVVVFTLNQPTQLQQLSKQLVLFIDSNELKADLSMLSSFDESQNPNVNLAALLAEFYKK